MLQIVVTTFNNSAKILFYFYGICTFTGKIIFNIILKLLEFVFNLSVLLVKGFNEVIFEFLNFIQELSSYASMVSEYFNELISSTVTFINFIKHCLLIAKYFIKNLFNGEIPALKLQSAILICLETLKGGFKLIGEIAYYVLMIVPNFIKHSIICMCNTIIDIPYYIKTCSIIIWNINLLALIVFSMALFSLFKFRRIFFRWFIKLILYIWRKMLQRAQFIPNIMSSRFFSIQRLRLKRSKSQEKSNNESSSSRQSKSFKLDQADNMLCIVCQEEFKCIVLLPCKHLCLCDECADNLRLYQGTCPLCRRLITNKMKIYV